MNKFMSASRLFCFAFISAVGMAHSADTTKGPSIEQRMAKRQKITPDMQMQRFGGFVTAEYRGRYCYFMNAQKRVQPRMLEEVISQIRKTLSLPLELRACAESSDDNFAPLREAWRDSRHPGAVVSIIDCPGWATLLVAPEDGWAQINVLALAKDAPPQAVLEKRLSKEIWRAFITLFGGGNSRLVGDVMSPVTSLSDLDAKPGLVPGPDSFNAVLDGARARGITCIRQATYKQACIEGWAPSPTNDFQKAIFEQVKAEKDIKPSNPLKVIYDPKKSK